MLQLMEIFHRITLAEYGIIKLLDLNRRQVKDMCMIALLKRESLNCLDLDNIKIITDYIDPQICS